MLSLVCFPPVSGLRSSSLERGTDQRSAIRRVWTLDGGFAAVNQPLRHGLIRRVGALHVRHAATARRANSLRLHLPFFRNCLDCNPKSGALCACPAAMRGAFRDRHERGRWDAVDATVLLDERSLRGRRSRVVLAPRCWRQACGDAFASRRRGWQQSRSPGRARIRRKTTAQGRPGQLG
jgi:hypothetical protein